MDALTFLLIAETVIFSLLSTFLVKSFSDFIMFFIGSLNANSAAPPAAPAIKFLSTKY